MENEIGIELFEEFPELLYNIRVIPDTYRNAQAIQRLL